MGHDINDWQKAYRPPAPTIHKADRNKAGAIFGANRSIFEELICEDIRENFNSPDPSRRRESKELLTKMKDQIFPKQAPLTPDTMNNGAIEEETVDRLTQFIESRRLIGSGKDQVDENNDGATFCT